MAEIDATDYRLAISQQQAAIARAELRLAQEQAEAEAAVRAWKQLEGEREAGTLVRREPQIRDAKLALAAAKSQLERSQLDLQRTKVMLPFGGRVRSVTADLGQTVQRGQRLAIVIDTSELEVRLPIPLADTGFLDLPLLGSTDNGPEVELTAEFGGQRNVWTGRIVRTEGEIDRRTRQLTVIARVAPPRGQSSSVAPPLLVGMFVEARIVGRKVDGVFVLPRSAVEAERVWIVVPPGEGEQHSRLRQCVVDVLRKDRDTVVVRSGLSAGDQICLTTLDVPVDDMIVRVADSEEQ